MKFKPEYTLIRTPNGWQISIEWRNPDGSSSGMALPAFTLKEALQIIVKDCGTHVEDLCLTIHDGPCSLGINDNNEAWKSLQSKHGI